MISAEGILEKYRILSPSQRNLELRDLFGLMPDLANPNETREKIRDYVIELGDDFFADVGRRSKAELRQILSQRLKILLDFAHITKTGQEYVKNRYEEAFIFGVSGDFLLKHKDPLAKFGERFGWEPLGREGMFGTKEAPEIEISLYRSKLSAHQLFEKVMREQTEKYPDDMKRFREFFEGWSDTEKNKYLETTNEEKGSKFIIDKVVNNSLNAPSLLEKWREEIIMLHEVEP